MNKKISGAKMVLVPIRQMGKNYLPFVEDLKSRYVKYIDFHPCRYLPGTADQGQDNGFSEGALYLTLANEVGNKLLFNHLPLEAYDYTQTKGVRTPIASVLSLQNSYIDCADSSLIGNTVALIFYYDLPQFSDRNRSDSLITDDLSVPITTDTFKNPLPDSERMSNKRFRQIRFTPVQQTPNLETGVSVGYENLYLTLRKGSYNVVENLPLAVLFQTLMLEKLEFANIIFDFQNSFITVGGAGTYTAVTGQSVFLNLTYEQR